jgi:hypothetical protein
MSHKSAQSIALSTIGIDLGKNSFHLVGFDQRGAIVLQLKCSRAQLERLMASPGPVVNDPEPTISPVGGQLSSIPICGIPGKRS